MDVNAVSSDVSSLLAQSAQKTPEAVEVRKTGGDNDGNSDDRGAKAAQAALAPSVNSSGQKTGQIVNVSA